MLMALNISQKIRERARQAMHVDESYLRSEVSGTTKYLTGFDIKPFRMSRSKAKDIHAMLDKKKRITENTTEGELRSYYGSRHP